MDAGERKCKGLPYNPKPLDPLFASVLLGLKRATSAADAHSSRPFARSNSRSHV
jgi:hypothetical protein